jgi:hypothetical protein
MSAEHENLEAVTRTDRSVAMDLSLEEARMETELQELLRQHLAPLG